MLQVDQCRIAGAVLVWLREAPVDAICVHCGEYTAGRALHGVCSVAADAAGLGIVGTTADADAAGATSPMLDVSGLTASRCHF